MSVPDSELPELLPTPGEGLTEPTGREYPDDSAWPPSEPSLSHHIPHLGHALLFGAIVFALLMASQGVLLLLLSAGQPGPHDMAKLLPRLMDTKLQIASMTVTYVLALLLSMAIFGRLWHRTFADGIHWNGAVARGLAARIVPAAMILSWCIQLLQNWIPAPKNAPIEMFFTTPSDVWLTALFGTLLAPLTEEIFFRGFLLPACAIAFDWTLLNRSPETYAQWRATDALSRSSLVFSAIFTSGLFALLHAAQLGYSWASVAVLMGVSLVLTVVRLRTNSVAASTLTHATYNFTIFLSLFIASGGFRHLDKLK